MKKLNAARERLRRVHFKSLGNILLLQEKIAQAWLAEAQVARSSPDRRAIEATTEAH